jgi:hypothetical protein
VCLYVTSHRAVLLTDIPGTPTSVAALVEAVTFGRPQHVRSYARTTSCCSFATFPPSTAPRRAQAEPKLLPWTALTTTRQTNKLPLAATMVALDVFDEAPEPCQRVPVGSTHTTISFYSVLPACDGRPLCRACFYFSSRSPVTMEGMPFCCSRGMPTNCSILCLLEPLRPLWPKPSSVALLMLPTVLLRPVVLAA